MDQPSKRHAYVASYSGMVCAQMVERDGSGDACGEPAGAQVHCLCWPHGPAEPCTCTGCHACAGRVAGCTCDIDWDCSHQQAAA